MTNHNAPSYDLDQAQLLLHSLISGIPKPSAMACQEQGELLFTRLQRVTVPSITSLAGPSARTHQNIDQIPMEVPELFTSWEDCMAWSMEITGSASTFVVDSQGFIIASQGDLPDRGIECIGAELVCSVETLERIDADYGKLAWIDLDFENRRIVGFIAPTGEEYFIVGLLSPKPHYHQLRTLLERQIMASLPGMD